MQNKMHSVWQKAASLLLSWFCATLVTTPFGAGVTQAVLLVTVLFGAYFLWKYRATAFHDTAWVIYGLLGSAVLTTIVGLYHGFDRHMVHRPLLLVVCVLSIGLWVLAKPSIKALLWGASIGAIGACSLALYQKTFAGIPRATGFHNAILFGDIALATGLVCLAGLYFLAAYSKNAQSNQVNLIIYFSKLETYLLYILLSLGLLSGIVTTFLSQSRGGWLALALCFIPLYSYTRSLRQLVLGLIAVFSLAAVMYFIPQTHVRDRVENLKSDLQEYVKGNAATSVGYRIELNKAGLLLGLENPIFGNSAKGENFQQQVTKLGNDGKIKPINIVGSDLRDTHNEVIQSFYEGGVLGVLAVLLLYAVPAAYFLKVLKGTSQFARPIALAGLLIVFATVDFGLSVGIFIRHIGKAYYFIYISILIGLCSSILLQEKQAMQAKLAKNTLHQ